MLDAHIHIAYIPVGVRGSGIKLSVDRRTVIVSRGDDVNITCTYNVDTYIVWKANGSIPVRRLGITSIGGPVVDRPGMHFNTLMIRNASSALNHTTFTCPLRTINASSHLYVFSKYNMYIIMYCAKLAYNSIPNMCVTYSTCLCEFAHLIVHKAS